MNKRQRLLSVAAAATLGLAGLIGAAAPAANAAAVGPVVINACPNSASPLVFPAPFITGFATVEANDTISFENQTGEVLNVSEVTAGIVSPTPTTIANGATESFTVNAAGDLRFVGQTTCTTATFFELVINSSPTPSPSSDSSNGDAAPAPVIQQFGMPATGTCDEAQPEGLNLSGVPSGGWGISWAQWMNGGTGGAVCTRTLVYSTDQSKWIVN